jgi:general secretion pathway protein K
MFVLRALAQDFNISILRTGSADAQIDANQGGNPNNLFGSTSDTFRITATGRVGRIEKQITAVVRYDDAMGKMLYWKED